MYTVPPKVSPVSTASRTFTGPQSPELFTVPYSAMMTSSQIAAPTTMESMDMVAVVQC